MRLSDIKGERTLEVIADLVDPIANIAMDEEAAAMFKGIKPADGESDNQAFVNRMRKAIPALLKTHKDDIVAILATVKGVSPDEFVAEMSLSSLIADVVELLSDEEFTSFLSSQQETAE
ncbi:MAG: hypothetical protein IJ111_01210 [Eggerthellaceae bacterium]|nr:hypothetical protein [Eggerthellaceae bacterium]